METTEPEEPTAATPEQSAEEVRAANEARIAYLRSHGIGVPIDEMYVTSLLEFVVGAAGHLEEAREFHERRVAGILDRSIAQLTVLEDKKRSAEARNVLLGRG